MIAVRGWERAKKMSRIEFLCGGRVLRDYRQANQTVLAVAHQFSAARDVTPSLVSGLIEENKQQARRIRDLLQVAIGVEAAELYQAGEQREGFRLVRQIFPGRDVEELKLLAQKITQRGPSIALLAATTEMARLVFARSADLTQNMGKLLGEACGQLGGKGGGRPELAQGGGPDIGKVREILEQLSASL
jgi:alanyl-tRNA synthetase